MKKNQDVKMKSHKLFLPLFIIVFLSGCKKGASDKPAVIETAKAKEKAEETISAVSHVEEELSQEMAKFENNFTYNYVAVDSPEGIKVRDYPDLDSNRVAGLKDKTVVKLLQEGPKATIDDITAKWLEIELPADLAEETGVKKGWVFGGYMTKNMQDTIPDEYFNTGIIFSNGLATVGSYVKANTALNMYSAASVKADKIAAFSKNDIGVIIRASEEPENKHSTWFYILNQSNGMKGWVDGSWNNDICPFDSTAAGVKISDTRQFYPRKNADVIVETTQHNPDLDYFSRIVLCSDNTHFVGRKSESKNLVIFNRNNDERKAVFLSTLEGYNGRDSYALSYSAKSNSVYFGWDKTVYTYSLEKDEIYPVFTINTESEEALSNSLGIQDIYVSKDEKYIFLVAEFNTSSRYIKRMIAYNAESKVQKIIDTITPNCDSDHYFDYGDVDFDENDNAIYYILSSNWVNGENRADHAFITVSSDPENWPAPVIHMLPEEHYSEAVAYIPGSSDILNISSRFCLYEQWKSELGENSRYKRDLQLKNTYRFAEDAIFNDASDYQFNEDKSICAVLQGHYIAFYSTRTFNFLFALPIPDGYWSNFWWNGTMLLVRTEDERDNYLYTSYNIKITEKDNQISDYEPLSKELVGLCAGGFRCTEYNSEYGEQENGYKFYFSPGGFYVCVAYAPEAESEYPFAGIIGGYEVTGDNKAYLYPSFGEYYPTGSDDVRNYDFDNFNLMPEQNGIEININEGSPKYNRFGDIRIYSKNGALKGNTYDYDYHPSYGVHLEDSSKKYQTLDYYK